jgi:hypothetical protein
VSDLPLVLDLFSGTGSATQPFVECGKHRVVRIDIAGKPDIRADVRHLPLDPNLRPEFVWASPPCDRFNPMGGWHGSGKYNPEEGMRLVLVAKAVIDEMRPGAWLLENTHGSVPHISKVLGPPMLRGHAWFLWGRCPGFLLSTSKPLRKGLDRIAAPSNAGKVEWRRWLRSRPKAKQSGSIPRPLAEAVHRAVCPDPPRTEEPGP